jgi:acetyltransferase-like isoleucine patch superfamily enzyme
MASARAYVFLGLRGVRFGRWPRIYGRRPIVSGGARITIGDRLQVRSTQMRVQLGAARGGRLKLGDRVYLNQGVTIWAAHSVTIGNNVRLADLACVYDTDFHELEEGAGVRVAPVFIEDNVWIGRGAIVLPGVTVGRHSVVAAGSVVTTTVPPKTLAAGAPARVVRQIAASDRYVRS